MRRFKIKKYIPLFAVICVALVTNFTPAEATQIYHPCPIIFVHGIAPGTWDSWSTTTSNLDQYFRVSPSEYKYFHIKPKDYFPVCDYRGQNNGDIPTIARTTLLTIVKDALSYYPPEVPEDECKVIIVCHSMGGLVLRSFLYQFPEYKKKIDRVIFIGTPHLGAPSASCAWSLVKIYHEIIEPMANDYSTFYSQNVGSRRIFADESSVAVVTGLIYDELSSEIQKYRNQINFDFYTVYTKTKGTPDPDGIALEQLRLAGDVRYHKIFKKAYKNQKKDITIDFSIIGANTFLAGAGNYLINPDKYSSIIGDYGGWDINIPAWWINTLREKYEPDFAFPIFGGREQSLLGAIQDGDGVVTTQSQLGIGGPHTTIVTHHTMEPNHYQAILQALDDPPEIVSIRAAAEQEGDVSQPYLFVKVKDYLLADIEISELTVNDVPVDLSEFHDPQTGTYKPYVKYRKDFLKEREDLDVVEFKVKINGTAAQYNINIKVKNPAGKESDYQTILSPNDIFGVRKVSFPPYGYIRYFSDYYAWIRGYGTEATSCNWGALHANARDMYLAEDLPYNGYSFTESCIKAYLGTWAWTLSDYCVGDVLEYQAYREYLRFDTTGYSDASSVVLYLKIASSDVAEHFDVDIYKSSITSGKEWSIDWWNGGFLRGSLIGSAGTATISNGYLIIPISPQQINTSGYTYVEIKSGSEDTYDPVPGYFPGNMQWLNLIEITPESCYLQANIEE